VLIPYRRWLEAKAKRRASGSWQRDMKPIDCGTLPDVEHCEEFDNALLGMILNPPSESAVRGRAVLCDVNINDDSKGFDPKGEK
jgi:hypothetical protein